jgi:putative ABC transport system permease protein
MIGFISLSALNTHAMSKQIMIRKILGATKANILQMLMKESVVIAALASCIAIPFSSYLFNRWVQNYAYRITYDIYSAFFVLFLFFILLALVIVFVSNRTINANPSTILKEE